MERAHWGMIDRKTAAIQLRGTLTDLIVEHVCAHPDQTNAEIATALGLESSFEGGQRNYLTFSLLADAVSTGRLKRMKVDKNVRYVKN